MGLRMSRRAWLWGAGLAIVSVAGLTLTMGRPSGASSRAAVSIGTAPQPRDEAPFPATALWNAILQHAQLAQAFGPGARARYASSLAALRPQAETVTAAIVERFDGLPAGLQELRFSLVFLLVELAHPRSEPLLARLAAAQDPPVTEPHSHHSAMSPSRRLRLVALNGLQRLTRAGSEGARRALLGALDHPDRQTRLTAARTLFLGNPNDAQIQAELRVRVRANERFAIDGSEKVYSQPQGLR
jgi:hypothetical protein